MRILRPFLPLAALLALRAPAQSSRLVDLLPEKTLGFLLFRDPVLSQVKLQGFLQRMKSREPDPLTEAQKAFGLPRLPSGRQGMAIV